MSAAVPARPFNPRVVAAVAAAGVVGFLLFLLLSAYSSDLRTRSDDPRSHALSGSAVGFRGLVRLVELSGGKVRLLRTDEELTTEDLVVVSLEEGTDTSALSRLLDRRKGKATLLIMPKWRVASDPERPGWVRQIGPHSPEALAGLIKGVAAAAVAHKRTDGDEAAGSGFLEGFRAPAPRLAQSAAGGRLTPLVTAGGAVLLARLGEGPHYLLAEPDLLSNHGLKDPRSARAALTLLAELNSTDAASIAFDVTLNGFGRKENALKLAFEPPFLPLTLALVVAAVLAGLHGAFRFGPAKEPERAIAFGKAALVENSASLFRIARREHRAAPAYVDLVRESAARETAADSALQGADLDAYLDRLSPADGPAFSALAARTAEARSRSELVEAARALSRWKKDLIQ